jgi:hypothetical protein
VEDSRESTHDDEIDLSVAETLDELIEFDHVASGLPVPFRASPCSHLLGASGLADCRTDLRIAKNRTWAAHTVGAIVDAAENRLSSKPANCPVISVQIEVTPTAAKRTVSTQLGLRICRADT